jgi:hypothetical protein
MEIEKNVENYIQLKKDKIIKLTNNKINSYFTNIHFVFDDMLFSKNFGILDNDNKKILMGKYEVLGYYNKYQKKWLWAFENKFIEKYLTSISKKIETVIYENKKKLENFDYDKMDESELNKLLNICLYYSDKIWISSRNINLDDNLLEFIIITDINQIN